MASNNYNWSYGENGHQKYCEAQVGKDYLCVFANDWQPDIWMGIVRDKLIGDKAANDAQREKENADLPYYMRRHDGILRSWTALCSADPKYMMERVAWCYENNTTETN